MSYQTYRWILVGLSIAISASLVWAAADGAARVRRLLGYCILGALLLGGVDYVAQRAKETPLIVYLVGATLPTVVVAGVVLMKEKRWFMNLILVLASAALWLGLLWCVHFLMFL